MADNNPEVLLPCPFCGRAGYRFNGGPVYRREPWVACYGTLAGHEHEYIAMPLAAWNTRAPAVSEEAVERVAIRRDVFDFLMGTGALGGYYFGESRPDMRGAFWWRTIMRAALSPTTPTEEPQS